MGDLDEIMGFWAADREGVSVLDISNIEFDFDKGWPGTEVTPGDLPEIVIKYTVTKKVVYRREASELGTFIKELASASFMKGG